MHARSSARFSRVYRFALAGVAILTLAVSALAQDADPANPPAQPPAQPSAPPTQPTTPPATTQPAAPRTDLPNAKDILGECIVAMGGEKAFNDMQSSMIKATFSNPMGEAKLEMSWMRPNKVFIKQTMQGAESLMGSDGSVSWMKTPMGTEILPPDAAKDLQDQSNMLLMVLRMRDDAKSLTTVDQVKFGASDCYKVSVIDNKDQEQFVFFDVKDDLIRGMETNVAGQGPAIVRFSEWKEDIGIKYFTKVEIEQMGMTMPLTFDEVKFNSLDASAFALPDEIKEMIKEQETPATQPATTPAAPAAPGGQ